MFNWWFSLFYTKKEIIRNINKEYYEKHKTQFLALFENENLSSNIDKVIYDKENLYEILLNGNNYLERSWKSRMLIENTPIGNISMYYDIFKHGFSYYCDQQSVPYIILNSVAMKYVRTYHCMDFFMDENILPEGKMSPLYAVFFEDKKENKTQTAKNDIDLKDAPFAKLKNYAVQKKDKTVVIPQKQYFKTNYVWFWRIWFNIKYFGYLFIINPIYRLFSKPVEKIEPPKENITEPKREKITNKFIYMGRFRNYNVLQKVIKPCGFSTSYDSMFSIKQISYKDFKSGLNNL